MISKSFRELVKGRWREFKREPSAMFFVVLMPVLWMVGLGLAFSGNGLPRYGVGIVSEYSENLAGQNLEQILVKEPSLEVRTGTASEIDRMLRRGEIVLVAKPDKSALNIAYEFDPANPKGSQARNVVNDRVQSEFGRKDSVASLDKATTIPGDRYVDFLVPGLLALSIFSSSIFGTGMTIVVNRRESLLKRYLTTPMSEYEYIASHIVARYFILVVEFAAVMLAAKLIFGFRVDGRWADYVLFAALGAAAATALGIALGARTANSAAYNGMTNLLMWPMTMFSGIWFSRSGFPEWLGRIVDYLPLTALVDGLRRIALEGAKLSEIAPQAGILGVYLLVGTIAAKLRFRWY